MTRVAGIVLFFIAVALLPFGAIAAVSVTKYSELDYSKQRELLDGTGCHEGGQIGDLDALQSYVDSLNDRYAKEMELGGRPSEEVSLVVELAKANRCVGYYKDEQRYFLASCQLQYNLAGVVAPEVWTDAGACGGSSKQTPEEQRRIKELMRKGWERFIKLTDTQSHERANFYRYQYGRMLYASGLDRERGREEMYEAALAEYQAEGVDDLDEGIANNLGVLNNAAIFAKDPQMYRFVAELRLALVEAGKLQIGGHKLTAADIKAKLDKWASEGIEAAAHTKALTELARAAGPPATAETTRGGTTTSMMQATTPTPATEPPEAHTEATTAATTATRDTPADERANRRIWIAVGVAALLLAGYLAFRRRGK